ISLTILGTTLLRMFLFPGGEVMNPFVFVLLATAGTFVGFLIINWRPARIYMGDTGSQFLGALLAFVGVKFFWNFEYVPDDMANAAIRMLLPIMVFLVPIMDTSFVTIGRLMRGQSPFVGGKDHLTHSMSYLGVRQSVVPVVLGVVSLISGSVATLGMLWMLPDSKSSTPYLLILFFLGWVVAIIGIFFALYKRGEKIGRAGKRPLSVVRSAAKGRKVSNTKSKEKQHIS
ncbi:MAG TPA: undecaprenyl/decaprenyl-phosphate alpha-N-acetylglucosaminyl 1-phosphate transferase, partial [Bacteroidetes bacterium]|nr:undecaprenyl/decaprenyl-phosphate alpha-N-acetylglucosaminyl 1-phosphate transferase [Bacteroidota bacterium]